MAARRSRCVRARRRPGFSSGRSALSVQRHHWTSQVPRLRLRRFRSCGLHRKSRYQSHDGTMCTMRRTVDNPPADVKWANYVSPQIGCARKHARAARPTCVGRLSSTVRPAAGVSEKWLTRSHYRTPNASPRSINSSQPRHHCYRRFLFHQHHLDRRAPVIGILAVAGRLCSLPTQVNARVLALGVWVDPTSVQGRSRRHLSGSDIPSSIDHPVESKRLSCQEPGSYGSFCRRRRINVRPEQETAPTEHRSAGVSLPLPTGPHRWPVCPRIRTVRQSHRPWWASLG